MIYPRTLRSVVVVYSESPPPTTPPPPTPSHFRENATKNITQVEAAPSSVFDEIAIPAIECGRILVPSSVGALLSRMHLVDRARETGARILVPTGAILGLDAIRAAAEGGDIESVTIETRKPPLGLHGAPYLLGNDHRDIDLISLTTAMRVFSGNAIDAAIGFPANANVAAAVALAGIGPSRTLVEIWADPHVTRNTHTVRVISSAARMTMTIENVPCEDNPRTGRITPLSIVACLRGLTSTLRVGS
jgi:aspartate dehydrogenase